MVVAMTRILFAALTSIALSTPTVAAERRFSVTDFDRVVVEGPYIVRLTAGRASSATASGSQAALDRLSLDVSGQTLRIRRNRQYWGGGNSGGQQGPLEIDLVTRSLRSARLIGPARLEVDRVEGLRVDLIVEGAGTLRATNVAADNLSLGLAGAGRIEIAGTAKAVIADVQGTGDLDAARLRAENARITTTTTGTVAMAVTRDADINALGLGAVAISGRPACTVHGVSADQVRCGDGSLNQRQQR
jgi:hypothetical protein